MSDLSESSDADARVHHTDEHGRSRGDDYLTLGDAVKGSLKWFFGILASVIGVGVVALFGYVLTTSSADAVTAEQITQLTKTLESLQESVDALPTKQYVDERTDAAKKAAKSHTDNEVSEVKTTMARQTAILERLDSDREDAARERRDMREMLTEMKLQLQRSRNE